MKSLSRSLRPLLAVLLVGGLLSVASADHKPGHAKKTWSVKADYIEACSCNLFCQCYFQTSPEGGEFCEFNNAVKIAEGHVGDTTVDGLKFWLSGDLGADFSKGEMKSAVVTFDKGTTQEQKDAIVFLVNKIYPVKWGHIDTDEQPITWTRNGNNGVAMIGDGTIGKVELTGVPGPDGKLTTIHNLTYWGAQKNDGFELAHSVHHYKGHGFDYDENNKNGFFIHIESGGDM
jgi:hypothetical protein